MSASGETSSGLAAKLGVPQSTRRRLQARPSDHLDIKIEFSDALRDVVAERYDAGVRPGEQVAEDVIAVRIGPDALGRVGLLCRGACKAGPAAGPEARTACDKAVVGSRDRIEDATRAGVRGAD